MSDWTDREKDDAVGEKLLLLKRHRGFRGLSEEEIQQIAADCDLLFLNDPIDYSWRYSHTPEDGQRARRSRGCRCLQGGLSHAAIVFFVSSWL